MNNKHKSYSTHDPRVIWVDSSVSARGHGVFDDPYSSINVALRHVQPGSTVVLKAGEYREDVTVQVSGDIQRPVRIAAAEPGQAHIRGACWFFYDSSDLIVSDLVFRDVPNSAIAVIGACVRNSFERIGFFNCSRSKEGGGTFFFGGSGGRCNVVENCRFEIETTGKANQLASNARPIALMISEGDGEDIKTILRDHIVRKNHFVGYRCAISVGVRGNGGKHGHIIEHNSIEHCSEDGIRIYCGDTRVRGNIVRHCDRSGVDCTAGGASFIEDNRIERCAVGITVQDWGHSVQGNCIVQCSEAGIELRSAQQNDRRAASSIFIEQNTFFECGRESNKTEGRGISGIRFGPATSSVIRKNLFCGPGDPFAFHWHEGEPSHSEPMASGRRSFYVITENGVTGGGNVVPGCQNAAVALTGCKHGDYDGDSEFGAHGWVAQSDPDSALANVADGAFSGLDPLEKYPEEAIERLTGSAHSEKAPPESLMGDDIQELLTLNRRLRSHGDDGLLEYNDE